jgi:hypothetical protein
LKASKDSFTIVLPIALVVVVVAIIVCYFHLCCAGRPINAASHLWVWLTGMRLADTISDFGFYFFPLRSEGFEARYKVKGYEAKLSNVEGRRLAGTGRYDGDVAMIQSACFAACVIGCCLTIAEIIGSRQRLDPRGTSSVYTPLLVVLLEDVPMISINIAFMMSLGGEVADDVAKLSLGLSALGMVANISIFVYLWRRKKKMENTQASAVQKHRSKVGHTNRLYRGRDKLNGNHSANEQNDEYIEIAGLQVAEQGC